MPGKWQIDELKIGSVMEATFWQNPGRFTGRWDDVNSDAGAVWSVLSRALREAGSPTSPS